MPDHPTQGRSIDETLCRRFAAAWQQGRAEPIERFLPAEDDEAFPATLQRLVCLELELCWKAWWESERHRSTAPGDETIARPLPVESYLQRFPQLDRPEIVLRLLRREYAARQEIGEPVSVDEYRRRFPSLEISAAQLGAGLPEMSLPDDDELPGDGFGNGFGGVPPHGDAEPGIAPGRFGNYELLDEIGRGGMGVVYRARQLTADRVVALKVIRRDRLQSVRRDTQTTALERFRHEAQAAARLEHENIVTVYEVGDVDGQPFFSMRYVEGSSLAEILKEGPIENRRAAAYLEPVARAVCQAHQQGVLHRDLKPQNILVDGKSDGALVADFGLAKLVEGGEDLTREGEVMGTPSYMSPEQARDSASVAAPSDVYALGATLYHVLSGRPPFQAATPVETLRQAIDEDPAPPRRLNPSIDRDLETICLKCLQKEPSRRYATAETLADDLRRYLDSEPILARPISTPQRALRWCHRNPALATWMALAATSLVGLMVVIGLAYVRTSTALRQSEESFALAQNAVDELFLYMSEERLLNRPGMQPVRRDLLQRARHYYRQFAILRGNDPTMREELATAHFRMGLINAEIDSLEKARGSYELARRIQTQLVAESPNDRLRLQNLAKTLNAIGTTWHGMHKLDQAREAFDQATDVRKRLVQIAPEESEFRRTLANSYMNIGNLEKDRGDFQEARRQYDEAQAVRTKLLKRGEDDPELRRDLGMGHYNLATLAVAANQPDHAQRNFRDAIAIFEKLLSHSPEDLSNQARLAICYRTLADLRCRDDTKQAHQLYSKALLYQETLARENPAVSDYEFELAQLHISLGQLDSESGSIEAALESFREADTLLDELVDQYPGVPKFRYHYALTLGLIAQLQAIAYEGEQTRGNLPAAEKLLQQARRNLQIAQQHLRELVAEFPDAADFAQRMRLTTDLLKEIEAEPSREE